MRKREAQISNLNFRELESNQRFLVQSQVSRPTATVPELFPSWLTVRGGGLEPRITGFKVRYPTFRRSPITLEDGHSCPSGLLRRTGRSAKPPTQSVLWESNPPVQLGRLAPLPLGQRHAYATTSNSQIPNHKFLRRKERELNPQGIAARRFSRPLPSPIGLPFQIRQIVLNP